MSRYFWPVTLALVFASGCGRLVDYELGCVDATDCPQGWACQADGNCALPCQSDADCSDLLPVCTDLFCAAASGAACTANTQCQPAGDTCSAGQCACGTGAPCGAGQTCGLGVCACDPGLETCGSFCLPGATCCANLSCGGALCTTALCDCDGGLPTCKSDCVFFNRCCDDVADCPVGQDCTAGACCAASPAATETNCSDQIDNDCDNLVDCMDAVECPAGTLCASSGAVCGERACGYCAAGEDLDGDGVCAAVDCDDSAATGATCVTGCTAFCRDQDGDTYGNAADTVTTCVAPTGYVADCGDCADDPGATAACGGRTGDQCHPGASESCDGADNDCDGATVDGSDAAGFGDPCDGADSDVCADDTLTCDGTTLACDANGTGDNDVEDCTDNVDNDCDGDTDCADADCAGLGCNDGLFCTVTDVCVGFTCVGSADPCAARIGDADADCSEACDDTADDCVASEPDLTACNDGTYCNGTDTCAGGLCANHAGDPCNIGDADCSVGCNESAGDCTSPNESAGSPCDDADFCNGADTCDGAGACTSHAGNPCPYACAAAQCCASNYLSPVACSIAYVGTTSTYAFQSGWCVTAGCFPPYYNLGSGLGSAIDPNPAATYCETPGSGASCTDPDAVWHVSCAPLVVDGYYTCPGTNCAARPYDSGCNPLPIP